MNILVLGGSSFIGSHLATHFKCLAPTHEELDLLDTEAVERYFLNHDIDVVIHAAHIGKYGEYVPDAVELNTRIAININRMKDYYKKLIYISSGAAYDKSRSLNLVKESEIGQHIPKEQYGLSKLVCSPENALVLNLFGVYGVNEGLDRFPSYALSQAASYQPIEIYKNCYFDYLYIDDLCRIVEYLLDHAHPPMLNVGSGSPVSLMDIAEEALRVVKSPSLIGVNDEGFAPAYTCNTNLLQSILPKDFKFTTMKEGLTKMFKYYRLENLN